MKRVANSYDQLVDIFKTLRAEVEQRPIDIDWKPWKPHRSPGQKGLMYAWITEITEHLNKAGVKVSKSTVKALLVRHFGPKVELFNEQLDVSTEEYSHEEMSDMLSEIQAWAATDLSLQLFVKGEKE
jgi:hypothetical protein